MKKSTSKKDNVRKKNKISEITRITIATAATTARGAETKRGADTARTTTEAKIETREKLNCVKMEFGNLKKSILSLFEMHDEYYYNYTHLIAAKLRNSREAAMDIFERALSSCAGDIKEFYTWISMELDKWFIDFATHIPTDNETVNRLREALHRHIQKDCRLKKFKQDLAYYIFVQLSKFDWPKFDYGGGRNVILKCISDYIYDLYCIEKKE